MDNLRQLLPPLSSLLPFEAAARLGSITRAGEELGLTQAAVSRQIKALESNLGIALFERRNRRIVLTDAGLQLSRVVAESLNRIGAESAHLRRVHHSDEVILFAQQCEGLYWLMPRLSRFYQTHPDIEVRITVSTHPLTESAVDFDLALQTSSRPHGDCEPLFCIEDVIFPICSPSYLERQREPVTLGNLSRQHLLHLQTEYNDWMGWDEWLGRVGVDAGNLESGSTFNSFPMMMQAALEGHGIGLGWMRSTEKFLRSGELLQPVSEQLVLPGALSIYAYRNRRRRRQAIDLLEWMKAEFEQQNISDEPDDRTRLVDSG